jgi:dihydroflavonol-4-reductase
MGIALVTGSTGFVGGQLCRALIKAGWQVRAFHRPSSSLRLLEDLPVEHVLGDLTRPDSLHAAVQGVQVVFHAAAMLGGRSEDPGRMYTITVEGTRALLDACLEAGVERLVHTSSVAALGVPENAPGRNSPPVLLNENHAWNYRPEYWPYGYAKYLAELEVQKAVARGLDAVIVNPSVVLGAGDIYRQNSSLVVQVARQKVPFVVDGGVNAVHIDDVVDGHLAALEHGRKGQRYILGGENLSIQRLVQKVAAVVGVTAPGLVLPAGWVRRLTGPVNLIKNYIDLPVSSSMLRLAGYDFYYERRRMQVELGLVEPRQVEDAIREAYEWFRLNGALD